ncbi:MAG TPA: protein kinase [Ktedonobacterales bacterium]|jgi:serine/threonine protein kinase
MTDYRGLRFGNYQLIDVLGKGGYAHVYLGEQIFLKTRAAIKVVDSPLEDQKIEQFRFEAGAIAHLDHPHIVRLMDFGVENTIPYLVMDYAPNGTLRQRHPQGMPIPLAVVVRYVQQVAAALDYAHQHRIIHRDIKPENLLLSRKNEVLLSDFGIAVVAHRTNSMTTQDEVGTISYIAPEQLRRKPRPASDQYALAVVVYEWLTGNVPFQGSLIEVAMQHMEVPPPPLHEPGSSISAEVERVVLKALEKHWQMRFASVREFAIALQEAHSPRPPFVREPGTLPNFAPGVRENLLDNAPTAAPPGAASTPEVPRTRPDEIPEEETWNEERQVGEPVPGDPRGERPTNPATQSPGSSVPLDVRRSRPHRLNRRTALLALAALLIIAGLGLGSLLLASGSTPTARGVGPGLTPGQTQQAQQGTTPPPGASAAPTGNPTTNPATPTTPGTTPNPTPTAAASPTATTTPPQLFVSPASLTFSLHLGCLLNQSQKTLTIQNTGGGELSWQASIQNTNYLDIDKKSGSLGPGDSTQIVVTASCAILITTTDTITFHWSGTDINVPVRISVLL